MKYVGFHYGGHPVYDRHGIYYVMLSKHRTARTAKKYDSKPDSCDFIAKVDNWHCRFNRLPDKVTREIAKRKREGKTSK